MTFFLKFEYMTSSIVAKNMVDTPSPAVNLADVDARLIACLIVNNPMALDQLCFNLKLFN